MQKKCLRYAFTFCWMCLWSSRGRVVRDAPVQNWNFWARGKSSLQRKHRESRLSGQLVFLRALLYFQSKFDKYPIVNGVTLKNAISNILNNDCVQHTEEEASK
jgi:hypothetical protein